MPLQFWYAVNLVQKRKLGILNFTAAAGMDPNEALLLYLIAAADPQDPVSRYCCAVLCCAVLCCAVLCCADCMLHYAGLCCIMLDYAAYSQSQSIKVPAAQSECHSQSRQNQSLPANTQTHCAVLASGGARSCCASAAVWTPQNRLWIWTAPHSWPSFSTCLKAHQSLRLPATAHRPRMWPQLWLIVTCCQLGCCCRAAS